MPQASYELKEKWGGEDGIGDDKAYRYLVSKGWTEKKSIWFIPTDRKATTITDEEWEALQFLIDEWDHGYEGWLLDSEIKQLLGSKDGNDKK